MDVTSVNTYNSIFNLTICSIRLFHINGTDLLWNERVFPYGAYEIAQLNNKIIRQLSLELDFTVADDSPIQVEANEATLHYIIHFYDGYEIHFTQPHTLRDLLGFECKTIQNSGTKNKVKKY